MDGTWVRLVSPQITHLRCSKSCSVGFMMITKREHRMDQQRNIIQWPWLSEFGPRSFMPASEASSVSPPSTVLALRTYDSAKADSLFPNFHLPALRLIIHQGYRLICSSEFAASSSTQMRIHPSLMVTGWVLGDRGCGTASRGTVHCWLLLKRIPPQYKIRDPKTGPSVPLFLLSVSRKR
jgi:hypothetical protein